MRTFDHRFLTEVANHPEVRPWLQGDGPLDFQEFAKNPENIVLQFEGGGWLLQGLGGCVYEVHSMFLPEYRGSNVAKCLKEAMEYVFLETDSVKLVSRLPKNNLAATALSKIAGFRSWFSDERQDYGVVHIEDWIQKSYKCLTAGQDFRSRLEAFEESSGSHLEKTDTNDAYLKASGAACLMIKQGNAAKGVWHYNQFAAFAQMPLMNLVSVAPVIVDIEGRRFHGLNMEPC